MKKILILVVFLTALSLTTQAQKKNDRRYIDVVGVAEIKVIPDEIYLSIALNEKDSKDRHSLKELEQTVVNVLRKCNIPTENLSISGANSSLEKAFWTGTKIYARKNYILKLTNANSIGLVMKELENKGISNVNLYRVDNSEIQKYRKEVKINAMKSAKAKADYLLNAIGEKTGKPIYIQERNYQPYYRSNAMMQSSVSFGTKSADYNLEFEEMTLRYEISARFEIAE